MESKNIGSLHVNITGDDSDLQKALDNSEKALNEATESVREFGTNIGILRAEYKKLSKESFAGKTPQEIEAIEMRLASLRDEIGDYQARINSLSADPFQKGAEAVQQLSTMLAGAAGAATLFGGSEEKLNALMQKTIALIAIAQAAQTAADFTKQNAIGIFIKDKYREIAARIKEAVVIKTNTAATVAETGAKASLSIVQKTLIGLQNTWNKLMASSPVFLLIGAIAAVTAGVIALYNAYKKHNAELELANKTLQKHQTWLDSINATNEYRLEVLRIQGKSEKEINDESIRQTQERLSYIRGEIALLEKQQKTYSDLKRIKDTYGSFDNARKQLTVYNTEFEEFSKKYIDLLNKRGLIEIKTIKETSDAQKEELARQRKEYEKFLEEVLNRGYQKTSTKFEIPLELNLEMPSPEELFGEIEDYVAPILGSYRNVTQEFSDITTMGLNDLAAGVAESVGNFAAGAGGFNDIFKSVGNSIADFTSSLGKALIAAGIGAIAFRKLLVNPAAAIAAGAGLVAVAAFIRSKLASGPSGSSGGGGYSVAGSGQGTAGGETGFRTIFANEQKIQLVGELRAEGNTLVAALYNENKRTTN